jgi:hypothetical protein
MPTRYLSNLVVAVLAGFAVGTSQALAAPTFKWIALGVGIGVVAATAPFIQHTARGRAQQAIDALSTLLGSWMIIDAVVFDHGTITWLGFGAAVALVGLALTGLTVHELRTERVVHQLSINGTAEPELAHAR